LRQLVEPSRDPAKQACPDFVAVDLIEHFVSSTGIEIVGDAVDAGVAIALYQEWDSFELLAHGSSLPENK
jgi:hypothetical protein